MTPKCLFSGMIPAKKQCHLKDRSCAQEWECSTPLIAISGVRTLTLFLMQLFSIKHRYAIITPHPRGRAVILKWSRPVCIR